MAVRGVHRCVPESRQQEVSSPSIVILVIAALVSVAISVQFYTATRYHAISRWVWLLKTTRAWLLRARPTHLRHASDTVARFCFSSLSLASFNSLASVLFADAREDGEFSCNAVLRRFRIIICSM